MMRNVLLSFDPDAVLTLGEQAPKRQTDSIKKEYNFIFVKLSIKSVPQNRERLNVLPAWILAQYRIAL
jgi:hypothetical protein